MSSRSSDPPKSPKSPKAPRASRATPKTATGLVADPSAVLPKAVTAPRSSRSRSKPLDDAQVAAWLQEHPDFFADHPALLETLHLRDGRPGITSLIERQVRVLRERQQETEERLAQWVAHARDNEAMVMRLHRLACALLSADHLDAVLSLTQETLREERGAAWIAIRLLIPGVDPLHQLAPADLELFRDLFAKGQPRCGRVAQDWLIALFPAVGHGIASVALMPLQFGNQPIGVLALGSPSLERFQPNMGTYFIIHLGELLTEAIRHHAPTFPASP
jgi:uncharacterized protein YigA (DUF484 family)